MSNAALVLVAGYPASGKSTLVKERYANHTHVNRDTHATKGSVADLLPKVKSYLQDGVSVVTDNLFATVASRKPFIDLALSMQVPCHCVVLDTTIEDAQVNVVSRLIKLFGHFPSSREIKESRHPNVFPPAVLYKFRKEYEEPSKSEGFDSVEHVPFVRKPWPGNNKAVLLDFDGTLRECPSGAKFPISPKDIKIKPGVQQVLMKLRMAGYKLLGVSNQSGIAKGDLNEEQCQNCFAATKTMLGTDDMEVLYCPHSVPPVSCYCRKPSSGMGISFIVKYDLDPSLCVMVGDMTTDRTFAKRCGFQYCDADLFFKNNWKDFL